MHLLLHLIYFYGMFYDDTIVSENIPSSNVTMINIWWITRNYTIQALETYSTYAPAVFLEVIHRQPVTRAGVPVQIRIKHRRNASRGRYRNSNQSGL